MRGFFTSPNASEKAAGGGSGTGHAVGGAAGEGVEAATGGGGDGSGAAESAAVLPSAAAGGASAEPNAAGAALSELSGLSELVAAQQDVSLPISVVMSYMDAFHSVLGLEWWAALGVMTFATRSLLLPFFMTTMKQTARMQRAKSETAPLQKTLQDMNAKVWADMRDGVKPQASPDALAAKAKLDAVYAKHGIDPRMAFVGLVPNLAVMISCYMGISAMAQSLPSFKTGGALWFADLSTSDPTLMLPMINGVVMFTAFQLAAMVNTKSGVTVPGQEYHKYLPYVGLFVPALTHTVPSGVQLYWIYAGMVNIFWQGGMYAVPKSHERLGTVAEALGWSGFAPAIAPHASAVSSTGAAVGPPPPAAAAQGAKSTVYTLGSKARPSQPTTQPRAKRGGTKGGKAKGGGRRRR